MIALENKTFKYSYICHKLIFLNYIPWLIYFIEKLLHLLHQLGTVILELAVEVCGVSTQMTHLELKCKHCSTFFNIKNKNTVVYIQICWIIIIFYLFILIQSFGTIIIQIVYFILTTEAFLYFLYIFYSNVNFMEYWFNGFYCLFFRGPVPVLVMSLLFIASVFMLHIWGKYNRA